jgi:hypothetical protein
MKRLFHGISLLAVILIPCLCASAAPKNGSEAANAVQGWLKLDPHPFGSFLSSKIKRTETIKDASGKAFYHVVHLSPHGYVVVSADDAIEPIIAFSSVGDFDSSATQGITPWVNYDLTRRMAHVPAADRRPHRAPGASAVAAASGSLAQSAAGYGNQQLCDRGFRSDGGAVFANVLEPAG